MLLKLIPSHLRVNLQRPRVDPARHVDVLGEVTLRRADGKVQPEAPGVAANLARRGFTLDVAALARLVR